jgi:hypothetical protein
LIRGGVVVSSWVISGFSFWHPVTDNNNDTKKSWKTKNRIWTTCEYKLKFWDVFFCCTQRPHTLQELRRGCGSWSEASATKRLATAASGGEDGGCVE